MYRGGRPRERGIEAQKVSCTGPDRLGPGFEPPLSRVCPGLGSRLGGTQYERYDPPTCAHLGVRWEIVPNLLEVAFYLASLVRAGSYSVSRFVPPLRLIALSPSPRKGGGPRQEVHHQPVLTASDLDLSHLLAVCPGVSA